MGHTTRCAPFAGPARVHVRLVHASLASAHSGTYSVGTSDMPAQAHALVQDAHDADTACALAKHDHMRADRLSHVRCRQVVASMTKVRVATDSPKRFVDLVAVDEQLGLAPGLAGVLKDVDEVLPGPRR